jgi:glycosyltransferase involved in cell wall biosynthesis
MSQIKRFAWFVLKSPQRKLLGFQTLLSDIKGILSVAFGIKSKEPIWVCIGIKDRSENLKRLVNNLKEQWSNNNFSLSVHDQGSADAPELHHWLKNNWPGTIKWASEPAPFSRAKAFNLSVAQAGGNLVFVCDADMTLPKNLEQKIRQYVTKHSAWFPICQWQKSPQNEDWIWFTRGTGIFAAHRQWHQKALGYDESITTWGGEDWEQFFRFYRNGFMPLRTRCPDLYHHWHKPTEPENWVKAF